MENSFLIMQQKGRKKYKTIMDSGINFHCKNQKEREELKNYLMEKKMEIILNITKKINHNKLEPFQMNNSLRNR